MTKQPMTVSDAIARLEACNPAAYLCLDDNGTSLEVVDLLDGFSSRLHPTGEIVDVVYIEMRGDADRQAQLVSAMSDHLANRDQGASKSRKLNADLIIGIIFLLVVILSTIATPDVGPQHYPATGTMAVKSER